MCGCGHHLEDEKGLDGLLADADGRDDPDSGDRDAMLMCHGGVPCSTVRSGVFGVRGGVA